jgi:hypothetical protein
MFPTYGWSIVSSLAAERQAIEQKLKDEGRL